MRKKISKFLYSASVLASLMSPTGAKAQIHPKAFKNVTKHYKPGKEYMSPTLGMVALESGLIHNLRFYGNYESGGKDQDGRRQYINDKSSDPLWNLVKALFPSPAGHLSVVTQAVDNFGRYIDQAGFVAPLYKFSALCREGVEIENSKKKAKDEADEKYKSYVDAIKNEKDPKKKKELSNQFGILKKEDEVYKNSLQALLTKEKEIEKEKEKIISQLSDIIKNKNSSNNTINTDKILNTVFKNIEGSIKQETDSIYPRYTTEQVISAFFCERFNTQKDIWELMRGLDPSFIDASQPIPDQEDLLNEKDLTEIASHSTYNIDDFYDLVQGELLFQLLPYKNGASFISNSSADVYKRKSDVLDNSISFGDCAETAARHVMNLLLYDSNNKKFDLTFLEQHIQRNDPGNVYFENFRQFYSLQKIEDANNGSKFFRNLWNTVVGDLNTPKDTNRIVYKHTTPDNENEYEIKASFINFIRVFEKIFSLKIGEPPKNASIQEKKEWLKESLNTLFGTINPTHSYEFDLNKLVENGQELSGDLKIKVKQEEGKELFNFTFHLALSDLYGHAHIENLQYNNSESKSIISISQNLKKHLKDLDWENTEECIKFLIPGTFFTSPLYDLFQKTLTDDEQRIKLLKRLNDHYDEGISKKKFNNQAPLLRAMMKHALEDIIWEDPVNLDRLPPLLFELYQKQDLKKDLENLIKSFKITSRSDEKYISFINHLKNLEFLDLPKTSLSEVRFERFEKLKRINLSVDDSITSLDLEELKMASTLSMNDASYGLENISLKNLSEVEEIIFPYGVNRLKIDTLKKLKKLDLSLQQNIRIIQLSTLPKLEEINLRNGSHLDQLELSRLESLKRFDFLKGRIPAFSLKDLSNLEEINLRESYINGLTLENLENLKKVDISETKGNLNYSFKNIPNVQEMNFSQSLIKKIDFKDFESLKMLDLSKTRSLLEVSLQNLSSLEQLKLNSSQTKTLQCMGLDKLEKIDLSESYRLQKLELTNMANLQEVDVAETVIKYLSLKNSPKVERVVLSSDIEKLEIENIKKLHNLTINSQDHLKEIFLTDVGNLDNINISWVEQLETLKIKNSSVKNLSLADVPLTEMTLTNLSLLENVKFGSGMGRLKEIDFSGSNIKNLEGLEKLRGLEKINLKGTGLTRASLKGLKEGVEVLED